MPMTTQAIELDCRILSPALLEPVRIAGKTFEEIPCLQVELRCGPHRGRGEAAGVFYMKDDPAGMPAQLERLRPALREGLDREQLRRLMPPGGARNALDCALWDLEARQTGHPAWQIAGLDEPRPIRTAFTLSANDPETMARRATVGLHGQGDTLKLKLTGDAPLDIERVRAVRHARPTVWIGVDANQAYTPASIEALLPALAACRVQLLEQPFARGREQDMAAIDFPMPTAADESCLDLRELETLPGRFDMVNIKLDKCGGLTEGLLMARRARELGLRVMVGNMGGTSLATAPAFLLGQLCDVVDLDGPTLLAQEHGPAVRYAG
ncbi:dipeptide epimerase, partial [Pelomonas sp. KK5]|uniref:dipeptide epimerase n=1 Tax=Pelomonas sp. KK5 TaxID=1855730 RepID=UPI00097C52D8